MPNAMDIKAFILLMIALSFAAFFRPKVKDDPISNRVVLFWFVAATILMLAAVVWVRFLLLAIAAIILAPKEMDYRPAFYLTAIVAIVSRMQYRVPFPGINYLIVIDPAMMVALAVGIPALIGFMVQRPKDDPRAGTPGTDFLVLFLVGLTAFLLSRGANATFTNTLRNIILQFTILYIPYAVMSRGLANWNAIRALVIATMTNGVMMVAAGLMCWAMNWNLYFQAATFVEMMAAFYRSGAVRVAVTTEPTVIGICLTAFMMALWFLRKQLTTSKIFIWGWLGGGLFILLATQARGAYLTAMAAGAALLVCKIKSVGARIALVTGLGAVMITLYLALSASGFESVDKYGTFEYRQELLEASVKEVKGSPFFGNPDYYNSPNFQHLWQGDGIIDFVNTYVQYALKFGLIGLMLHILLFSNAGLRSIKHADRLRFGSGPLTDDGSAGIGYGVAALMAGMMAMIMTISTVSYIEPFLSILVGTAAAYARVTKANLASATPLSAVTASPQPEPAPQPHEEAAKPNALPGRKPFEIDVTPGPRGWSG
ncbi:O-antigen ligase family protein [Parvularcula sp. LCG005]|uniref:O-antigen ligase family protein n=1 Tax=Parvularcula sp. LCG005 TaxID=3078805 RepID=UPI002942C6B6|nr:O-antigen ligase family protein [Parvularcula sp. LCG005]WOI52511.1 O-antigen ligase family protein [Parvularcula sp. LCG005]